MAVNYAVNDNITVGGGISVIPGIDFDQQFAFINPKVGFDLSEKISLGGGILYATLPYTETNETRVEDTIMGGYYYEYDDIERRANFGLFYGVGTYGSRESNATLGIGYAYINDEFAKYPIFVLGGMHRTSRRTALVTENWFVTLPKSGKDYPKGYSTLGVISYGIRFFGERMCVDLAFFNTTGRMGLGEFIFPGIPYLDFIFKF